MSPACLFIGGWGMPPALMAPWLEQQDYGVKTWVAQDTVLPLPAFVDPLAERVAEGGTIVGWSLGGQVATHVAAAAQSSGKQVSLVTVASNPCFVESDGWPGMAPATFEAFLAGFRSDPQRQWQRFRQLLVQGAPSEKTALAALRQQVMAPPFSTEAMALTLDWLGRLDTRSLLATLTCPVTHWFFGKDALVPVAVADHLRQQMPGHTVHVVDGEAHLPEISWRRALA